MNGVPYTQYQLDRVAWVSQEAHRRGRSIAEAIARELGTSKASAQKIAGRLRKRGVAIPYDTDAATDPTPEPVDYELPMLYRREDWQKQAACRGLDPELFFPGSGGRSLTARAVCAACPVADECLDYALRLNEKAGVWGGTTWTERRKMARPTVRVA
jgi:WhiB family transcriptional regulator, redox-sensing transcriptional regulator